MKERLLSRFTPPNREWLNKISNEFHVSQFISQIVWNRGIKSLDSVKNFLRPDSQPPLDSFLLKDMHRAVHRIELAIQNREKICVYGDYDVDGMTSVAILTRALENLGADVVFYIPDRESEGYGLNVSAIRGIIRRGAKLIVTVDNGIAAVNEIEATKDQIDFIVTDHHEIESEIPQALAVIDPKRTDCPYPNKNLCGCGVAFKLIQALYRQLRGELFLSDLDIVALATIADLVPLIHENRKIVRRGLNILSDTPCLGLQALIESAGLSGRRITEENVGFILAPRLNAAGRMFKPELGVELLTTRDPNRAREIAETLEEFNSNRKELERQVFIEAEEKFLAEQKKSPSAIIVDGENWHPGVIGLAASRLQEKYYLPTLVFTHTGGILAGSCRSIDSLNIFDALSEFADLYEKYGGHSKAAGLSIRTENFPIFRKKFLEYVATHTTSKDFIRPLVIDCMLDPSKVTLELISQVENLAPFGVGNSSPIFGWKNVRASNVRLMGKDQSHLGFSVGSVRCVGWRMAEEFDLVSNREFTMIFSIEKNEFNGSTLPQCNLIYISP